MTSQDPKNSASQPKIKVIKNGPYFVSGSVPLQKKIIKTDAEGTAIEWQHGADYPTHETCSLCRCGQSKNKPYCDGTHSVTRFDGGETADQEVYFAKPDEIDGPDLKLIDVKELCASARFCHRDGGIWNLVPKSNDPKASSTACEEASDCPSGRLILMDKKNANFVELKFERSLYLIEDPSVGVSRPIWVRGGIPIESADGKTYKVRNRVTLCRCGKSQNKPFCDSSHYPEDHEAQEVPMHESK